MPNEPTEKKKVALEETKFPPEGVTIPAQYLPVYSQFDKDGDGRLSPAEFAKTDPAVQQGILNYIARERRKAGR